jgi:murein DD-endopeptidase MepM/ murein hydrolase activator NlpD
MATSRLANILRQEYKTKGLIGGAASSLGKRSLEKLDIRNALFSGGGIGSIIGTKIFGKGYSATKNNNASNASQRTSPSSLTSDSSSILQDINTNSKITAKNSMALPAMAKQMNMMQKNIGNLTQYMTGKKSKGPDSYFKDASFRENAYESQFKAGDKKPTKIESKEKSDAGLGLLGMIGSLVGSIVTGVATVVASSIAALGSILTTAILGLASLLGLKTIASALPIPGIPGKKGAKTGGKGKFGSLLMGAGLITGGLFGYNALKNSNTEGGEGGANGQGESNSFTDTLKQTGQAATQVAATVGAYKVGGIVTDKLNARATEKSGGKVSLSGEEGTTKFKNDKTGKYVKGKNLPLGEVMEKMRVFADKAYKKGWTGRIYARVIRALGVGVAIRLSGFFAGLIAAPFSAGISALISLALAAWTTYDIYLLYDLFFGNGNMEKELEDEDAKASGAKSPTIESDTNKTSIPTPTATPTEGGAVTGMPNESSSSPSAAPSSSASPTSPSPAGQVGTVSSDIGMRNDPTNSGKTQNHQGVDVAAPAGTPVYATMDGTARKFSNNPTAGNYVEVTDAQGNKTRYLHMSGFEGWIQGGAVRPVKKGEKIGTVGSTGRSTGNHLHFEEYKNGKNVTDRSGAMLALNPKNTPGQNGQQPNINGSVLASASAAKESASMSQSMFSSADMADILSVIGGPKTSGSSSGSGMNQVVSTSKSTPYHSDFYSNLVRTQSL